MACWHEVKFRKVVKKRKKKEQKKAKEMERHTVI